MTASVDRLEDAAVGFFGKIPARGDFVRAGLPSSFVGPWDSWMSRVLAGSQARLGEDWRPAWMEAPIWYFALAADVCGPDSAIGLWMPSVDHAGRNYPLMIAAVVGGWSVRSLTAAGAGFLAEAERAGLDALEHDLAPGVLAGRVAEAARGEPTAVESVADIAGTSLWWTAGSPLVPASALALRALPDDEGFARMLDARGDEMVA